MNLTENEMKILQFLAKTNLVTKTELKKNVGNGSSETALNIATRNLMEKELIASINPIGSTCYVITQKGTKFLRSYD